MAQNQSDNPHEYRINFNWPFNREISGERITAIPLRNFRQLIFDNKWNYVLFDSVNSQCIVCGVFDENENDFESYSYFSHKY